MRIALVPAAISLAAATSAWASEEDHLVWKSVQIDFGESAETGKIGLAASSDKNGLASLEITAFGKTWSPKPEELNLVREYPIESLRVTRDAGDAKVGTTIHFKFQREYYDKVSKLLLIREEAVLSVAKGGITISLRPQKKS